MTVVNKRTHKPTPNDLYIGRPSILGNPFVIGRDGTREEVINKYEDYAWDKIETDDIFRQAIIDSVGSTLVCWCSPEACHGDVIEMIAHVLTAAEYKEIENG